MSNSVDPQAVDETAASQVEGKSVDSSFKALWESARRAAETIARLRDEKRELQEDMNRREQELQQLRQEVAQLRKQATDHAASGTVNLAGTDRDQLAAKVKELIARLDAYL